MKNRTCGHVWHFPPHPTASEHPRAAARNTLRVVLTDSHFRHEKLNNSVCFYCIYNSNMSLITSKGAQMILSSRLESSLRLSWRAAEEQRRRQSRWRPVRLRGTEQPERRAHRSYRGTNLKPQRRVEAGARICNSHCSEHLCRCCAGDTPTAVALVASPRQPLRRSFPLPSTRLQQREGFERHHRRENFCKSIPCTLSLTKTQRTACITKTRAMETRNCASV